MAANAAKNAESLAMTAMNASELMGPSWECPEQQPNDPGFIDLTGGSDMDQPFGGYDPQVQA